MARCDLQADWMTAAARCSSNERLKSLVAKNLREKKKNFELIWLLHDFIYIVSKALGLLRILRYMPKSNSTFV